MKNLFQSLRNLIPRRQEENGYYYDQEGRMMKTKNKFLPMEEAMANANFTLRSISVRPSRRLSSSKYMMIRQLC